MDRFWIRMMVQTSGFQEKILNVNVCDSKCPWYAEYFPNCMN